jgi:hypothetical protein
LRFLKATIIGEIYLPNTLNEAGKSQKSVNKSLVSGGMLGQDK